VGLLVAVTGRTLAYGDTTWGEMLATGLVTLLVAAAVLPARPPFSALTVALVTLVVVRCLLRFRGETAGRLSTPRGR
jgi:hypothetical protein